MNVKKILNALLKPTGYEIARQRGNPRYPLDFTDQETEIIKTIRPYTMAKEIERIYPIVNAVRYVVEQRIPGSVVECGVWRGGMMMAAAKMLLLLGDTSRELYLFDTYEGMVEPGGKDLDVRGTAAIEQYRKAPEIGGGVKDWCYAGLEEVTQNLRSTGYPKDKIHLIKGRVEATLPGEAPESISILRLDTDWYESSKHELVHLYPRMQKGGVLILDDYGFWQGCRQATDEYFKENNIAVHLVRVDSACRVGIKL